MMHFVCLCRESEALCVFDVVLFPSTMMFNETDYECRARISICQSLLASLSRFSYQIPKKFLPFQFLSIALRFPQFPACWRLSLPLAACQLQLKQLGRLMVTTCKLERRKSVARESLVSPRVSTLRIPGLRLTLSDGCQSMKGKMRQFASLA